MLELSREWVGCWSIGTRNDFSFLICWSYLLWFFLKLSQEGSFCLLLRSSGAGGQDEERIGCWNGFASQKGRFSVLRCKTGFLFGWNTGNHGFMKYKEQSKIVTINWITFLELNVISNNSDRLKLALWASFGRVPNIHHVPNCAYGSFLSARYCHTIITRRIRTALSRVEVWMFQIFTNAE